MAKDLQRIKDRMRGRHRKKAWLSKNTDKQEVAVFQVRNHTTGMLSAGKTVTTQEIEVFTTLS
jgi:hypothetical protein